MALADDAAEARAGAASAVNAFTQDFHAQQAVAGTLATASVEGSAALDALLSRQTIWRAGRAPMAPLRGEPTGFAALDALLPQAGWPCAALTELLLPCDGVGEMALLLPTLARLTQAGGIVVLIAPPYVPYAPAWREAGVALPNLHIIEADTHGALWAFEQCLRSGACAAVLGWPQQADAPSLRRLQVAAGSGDCLGFAFRDRKHAANPSPAALRIEYVRGREGEGSWHVRKCRGSNAPAQPFVPGESAHEAAPPVRLAMPTQTSMDLSNGVVPFPLSPAHEKSGREGTNRGDAPDIAPVSEAETCGLLQTTGTREVVAFPGSFPLQPYPRARESKRIPTLLVVEERKHIVAASTPC
jgi:cell division inhibitor SulA